MSPINEICTEERHHKGGMGQRYYMCLCGGGRDLLLHDDVQNVIKWKHFPRYWPFVREIHQSQELWCFLDLHLNKRSKQSRCRGFEPPSHSLWRHCNVSLTFAFKDYSFFSVYFINQTETTIFIMCLWYNTHQRFMFAKLDILFTL